MKDPTMWTVTSSAYPATFRRLAAAAALLAGAGCSGGSEDAPPAEAPSAPPGVHGTAPAAAAGTPSVVTLTPISGAATAPAARENPHMDQLGLAFTPGLLMVRTGETVTFTNSETIAHNVHVAFSDNDSTVLVYDTDPSGSVDLLMEREGGYEVTCDLHPGMRAFIYVTSAPYAEFASNAGDYHIEDVPPGSYALNVWSVDPTLRSERTIEVTGSSTAVP
jgi:plastocyanin